MHKALVFPLGLSVLVAAACGQDAPPPSVGVQTSQRAATECVTGVLPAQIEGEEYCGFSESTPGANSGASGSPQCDRGDGVDIQATSDDHSANCNIGWTSAGEYLDYQLDSPGGAFEIILRASSSPSFTGRVLSVELDGAAVGSVMFDGAGWQSFSDFSVGVVDIPPGPHALRVTFETGTTNLNHIELVSAGPSGTALIDADFSTGADGFTYADDTFRGTSQPNYASGSVNAGAIEVVLGGLDNVNISGMSGGWSADFSLPSAGDVDVSFDYSVTFPCNYEPNELGEVLLSVDGSLVGSAGGETIFERDGASNCNDSPLAGNFSTTLSLSAGSHTLVLGGYNNLKTWNTELMTVRFDNVRVESTAVVATCADGIQNQDETDVDCGGTSCGACADGQTCSVDGDCASANCVAGVCEAPPAGCSNGSIPATIEAETYCGFFESTPETNSGAGNAPECDRGDGVDIEATVDSGSPNCNIGWTVPGEYWEYNVLSPGGTFDIVARAASNSNLTGLQLEAAVDGTPIGTVTFDGSGWQSFADYAFGAIALAPGPHTIRVTSLTGNTNFNHLDIVTAAPSCSDGIQNQDETDVDCGGAVCGACAIGGQCLVDDDCASLSCVNNQCEGRAEAPTFTGEYYTGINFDTLVTTRNDPDIDFDWLTSGPPGLPVDGYSVRWTGTIVPEYSEVYTLSMSSDDGARVFIDGQMIIDDWTIHAFTEQQASFHFEAGQSYEITVEYFENTGFARVLLEWQSPSVPRRVLKPSISATSGLDGLEPFSAFLGGVLPDRTPGDAGAAAEAVSNNLGTGLLLSMEPAPNSNLLYVGSRDGRIETIDPSAPPGSGTPFLDIRSRVWTGQDSGLLGMAFHPDFGLTTSTNGEYFYLYYVTQIGGDEFIRLSRFNKPIGQATADPNSEFVLIQQRLGPTLHRGGGLLFGSDGFLYLSIGDLGWPDRTQSITDIFIGGVLRIDVDSDPNRSHPIVTPLLPGDAESFTQGYFVPDSNPWVGQPGVLEEFYAIGSRNPHRMSIDRVTGRILIGNVGSNTSDGLPTSHEEINELVAGANFGWPFREAYADFAPRPSPLIGTLRDPNFAYPRSTGACIIGGFVYRGSALPQLFGRYIVGDCTNNNVWAMADDAGNGPQELLFTASASPLTTFGIDNDGEVYLGGGGSTVYRLAPSGPAVPEPPALLSATGAFADLATLQPVAGFIPYGMSNPLWSDASAKLRWMGIPNDGLANTADEQIVASTTGDWSFPAGTVFIKHFELPLSTGGTRRLETRFLVHGTDGRYWGVTYRWRPDGSDADLLTTGLDEVVDGQTWHYPSRTECLQCHNTTANQVLGPRTAQLNRPMYYGATGVTANQVATLDTLGLFSSSIGPAASWPAAKSLQTLSAPLETRVKSYLSSNCAHCHRPGGQGRGEFDTRFETALADSGIVNGGLADDLGIPGARVVAPQDTAASVLFQRMSALGGSQMPPLARNVVHDEAIAHFSAWIGSVNEAPGAAAPSASSQSVTVAPDGSVLITLAGSDPDGDAIDFVVRQTPAHGVLTGVAPSLVYTPHAGYVGADTFTVAPYDGAQFGSEATVSVTVSP